VRGYFTTVPIESYTPREDSKRNHEFEGQKKGETWGGKDRGEGGPVIT